MANEKNARFWVSHRGGWVKLTLTPGQSLVVSSFERHDEGWSSSTDAWQHRGDHVVRGWGTDGVDCDGRMSDGGEDTCALADLMSEAPDDFRPYPTPKWERADRWHRDYAAEAAGY